MRVHLLLTLRRVPSLLEIGSLFLEALRAQPGRRESFTSIFCQQLIDELVVLSVIACQTCEGKRTERE
jgi:hypothetical protein